MSCCLIVEFWSCSKENIQSIFQNSSNFTEQIELHFALLFKNTSLIEDVHINIYRTGNIAALKFNICKEKRIKKKVYCIYTAYVVFAKRNENK